MMRLNYREYGSYTDQHPTLILLHGLLGSSSNWLTIAKGLADRFHVLVPDLRNHGRSPHDDDVSYAALARDIEQLIDEQGLDSALLIGHSMGGKAAMWLALEQPERVTGLVVVDIAPVAYPNRFDLIYTALHAVDQAQVGSRTEADSILAQYIDEIGLRQFLLQNLHSVEGSWVWRMNLTALTQGMSEIVGFSLENPVSYRGQTLFIYGGKSDYVGPNAKPIIKRLFPQARLEVIPAAGHWVYAEQPKAFVQLLMKFLSHF
ncbi:MAG: alpha/beta fold hydrolase [Sedimenticola sp.]|uniref:Alpha/beta fold hydrolase n=1 Tax=Sedimenticola thiotaurini TaxID=1543721 RepID=A0A558D0K8_9GAMM|nr:alpha/beta fold hydrolase [Sedimenticola sp.]TVT54546.1 MAG: alpha/beta fold hydrolase [Sedimenticola thiotaurini]MCW8881790.1 alpha/beta fold hydrolase [Sedimenticola sp.]MCW8920991.1 alpha/beta fold hydrolase [Sedimenticola sp.]MCW8947737.1 alpha/beta fold hydrolase [Sedimenticola sp.]